MASPAGPSVATQRNSFNREWLLKADKNRQLFPDELFTTTFSQENVEKLITELKEITNKKVAESRRLCDDDHTFSLQLNSFGWVQSPMHLTRIELPYTVLAEDAPIVVIVKDIKRPIATPARNAKPANIVDLTIKHYEQLFASKKIDVANITFLPLSQLINEYTSYDQRRKLTYLYDKFLVEASIGARVNAFLGTKLLIDGRVAYPIELSVDDLATEYDIVIRQVVYQSSQFEYQMNKPFIRVGRFSQLVSQVAENIIDLVGQLGSIHPGGSVNIQNIHLRTNGNLSTYLKLYSNPATVAPEIPVIEPVPVVNADGTVEPAAVEVPTLTEPAFNVPQHIICSHHYIMSEEDDYSQEFDWVAVKTAALNGTAAKPNAKAPLGSSAPAKRTTAASPAAGPTDVNALVMRTLQKLLTTQNLGALVNQRARVSNGNGVRRGGNHQSGGQIVRRQATANNAIQKRRYNPNASFNGNGNGNVRNNRRFI